MYVYVFAYIFILGVLSILTAALLNKKLHTKFYFCGILSKNTCLTVVLEAGGWD